MYFLRLKRRGELPDRKRDTEAIFAAEDGTLKHMDPDGNVEDLAGAGSLPSPTSEGDVLTVVSGDWAGAAPSGGSQPVTGVRIAFDTDNLYTQAFDITDIDVTAQTVTVAGDHTALFPVANYMAVSGSNDNDSTYKIGSVSFTGGNTVVTVDASTPLPGTDDNTGKMVNIGTAGVAIYTPSEGEFAILDSDGKPLISTHVDWDHSPWAQLGAMYWGLTGTFSNFQLAQGEDNFLTHAWSEPQSSFVVASACNYMRFNDDTPFKIMVTDSGGILPPDPLPTQGESFLALWVVKGATS